jgi:DNA mismatch repair protein MSH5
MDDEIGDINAIMMDTQKGILLKIENAILLHEGDLIRAATCLDSLDAILSLGSIASELNFSQPQIVDSPILVIKGGRHPLQELALEGDFVANDTFLSGDKNIGLITGYNG